MPVFVKVIPHEHLDKRAISLPDWAPSPAQVVGFIAIDASKLRVQLGNDNIRAKDYPLYVEGFTHTSMYLIGPGYELVEIPVGETTEPELLVKM